MKFEYTGRPGMIDFTLILENILPLEETLTPGQIIEIEDNHPVVERLRKNGNWTEQKGTPRPKKVKDKKMKKEEKIMEAE